LRKEQKKSGEKGTHLSPLALHSKNGIKTTVFVTSRCV